MNIPIALQLIGSIAIPLVVGGVSGIATAKAIPGWYAHLRKPSFNPPNRLFGPAWTLLYILMGVSLFLIWQLPESAERNMAFLVFGIQLFLNFSWSIIFFYFKRADLALVEISILWLSILWMIIIFIGLKPMAGYLQIPYLCWVSFAALLNVYIWKLNK